MLDLTLLRKRFGKEIVLYRIKKKMSQEELAKRLHISRATLSTLENGTSKFDDFILLNLYHECKGYVFFMMLYAFYGSKIRSMVNLFRIGKSDSHVLKLLKRLRKLGPVDKPRYYDNDVIRVIYKPEKKKNTWVAIPIG